jgi:hypothetical protein
VDNDTWLHAGIEGLGGVKEVQKLGSITSDFPVMTVLGIALHDS